MAQRIHRFGPRVAVPPVCGRGEAFSLNNPSVTAHLTAHAGTGRAAKVMNDLARRGPTSGDRPTWREPALAEPAEPSLRSLRWATAETALLISLIVAVEVGWAVHSPACAPALAVALRRGNPQLRE